MPDEIKIYLEKKLVINYLTFLLLITIGIFKNYKTEVAANMAFDYKFSKEVKENTTENLQLDIAVV
jgi:hypothetical protein